MKKIFLTLSVLAITTLSLYANPSFGPGPNVEEVFKKEFPGAQSVVWTQQEDYHKATFILAGHRTVAFFDQDDQLVGCVRDIFFDQLPIAVMKAIDKKFPKSDYSEVREIHNADGTAYMVMVDKDNKKFKVKVSPEGSFNSIERIIR